ncbi:MAG: hypothetical protein AUH05_06435 [Ktedonobacter sp. 13_2_20CM_53_11]|nr:MAG: hypothetical protein AUH05_06435 [Ktedonobacter sp. 13_2_20CM_53_11]
MPEKDPLLERQQLHADSLEGDDKADGGLYTMGQTNAQRGILQGKRILVRRISDDSYRAAAQLGFTRLGARETFPNCYGE